MGYGQRALQLLFSHYAKKPETDSPCPGMNKENPALLLRLDELEQERLDYIGVSYGLTLELLRFWKKLEFVPLYVRQTASETTGEHSCIMAKTFEPSTWLAGYLQDFVQRFATLLTSAFRNMPAALALEILRYNRYYPHEESDSGTVADVQFLVSECSLKRLEAYCNHLVDYHLIMDLVPVLARAYFSNYFRDYFLSSIQETILLCVGLQNKSVEDISQELNMETNQVMGLFMKIVKKMHQHVHENGRLNRGPQDLRHCDGKTQNYSTKHPSLKRKRGNIDQGERKKQRHRQIPS